MAKTTKTKELSGVSAQQEQQFAEVVNIILQHRSRASRAVNEEVLLTAWSVGGYVSSKLKSEEWGSRVVTLLSEYIRSHYPDLKGYGRSNIYNMVMFYDEYSSLSFQSIISQFISQEFVQPKTGQLVATKNDEFVQPKTGQIPKLLTITTFTNHIEILSRCNSYEERLFYILYSHKERLNKRELDRCITNQTFSTLLGTKKNLSKGLLRTYPDAPIIFKDTVFVDFLGLPKKHSEAKLRNGLIQHIKEFILELGKDFLFVDQEYRLEVGASIFKADLLFFHRGIQALVAIECKRTKFHPRDLGQLEFYLEALDRDVKRSNENPSVGIILCPEADEVVVEYAMNRSMSPTLIAQYKRLLIPKERMQKLLNEFCNYSLKNVEASNTITMETKPDEK